MLDNCAVIQLAATHNELKLIRKASSVAKTVEALKISVEFRSDDWNGLTKTVIFIRSGVTPIAQIMPANSNCVTVPWEILNADDDCFYEVGIIGTGTNNERMPTNRIKLKADKGCCLSTVAPQNPTPSVYEQILATIQGLNDYDEDEIKAFVAEYISDNNCAEKSYVDAHINNSVSHITSTDRQTWNAKADVSDIPTKVSDLTNDAGYLTAHQDISGKQDTIADLDAIRSGAALGATAIQDISGKQDKIIAGENIVIAADGKTISAPNNAYEYIKQVADYLFEVQYTHENIDYDLGNQYFKSVNNVPAGGCSAVRKGDKVLRHLDWYYDDGAEFVIRTVSDPEHGLKASIGMCSGITGLTRSVVESGEYNAKFKIAPLIMTDGINESGIYIQSNVVPNTGFTYNLNPSSSEECCITMVLRYILDHCDTIQEVEEVFDTLHIYSTNAITYGYHFFVSKGNEWEIIELTANGYNVIKDDDVIFPIMTNFRVTDLSFEGNELDWNSVEPYGIGLERYDLAAQDLVENKSLEDIREDLMYSRTYTNEDNKWRTEFAGYENPMNPGNYLTVLEAKSDPSAYDAIIESESAKNVSKTRSNGLGIWHTTHSAIYDLTNYSFNLVIQERLNTQYNFALNTPNYLTQQSLVGLATETYVDTKINQIPTPDVSGQINIHNTSPSAHSDLFNSKADRIGDTVVSDNADFAEIGEWHDGNPNDENRIGHFVTLTKTIEGFVIDKATATSDVCGVIVSSPAFSGNADDKYDSNGNLKKQYDYVALLGLVPVIDNGTCTVPGKCMPTTDGTAVPSTNNMGFNVISRIDSTHIEVFVRPGADMIQRIKSDILNLETSKYEKPTTGIPASDLANGVIPDVSGKMDTPTGGSAGNVLTKTASGVAWSTLPDTGIETFTVHVQGTNILGNEIYNNVTITESYNEIKSAVEDGLQIMINFIDNIGGNQFESNYCCTYGISDVDDEIFINVDTTSGHQDNSYWCLAVRLIGTPPSTQAVLYIHKYEYDKEFKLLNWGDIYNYSSGYISDLVGETPLNEWYTDIVLSAYNVEHIREFPYSNDYMCTIFNISSSDTITGYVPDTMTYFKLYVNNNDVFALEEFTAIQKFDTLQSNSQPKSINISGITANTVEGALSELKNNINSVNEDIGFIESRMLLHDEEGFYFEYMSESSEVNMGTVGNMMVDEDPREGSNVGTGTAGLMFLNE